MALALLLFLGALFYCGWFFGQVHEAMAEDREAQLEEAAYRWAAKNGKLPTETLYVDTETGEIL